MRKQKNGFTIIELMVVVLILGVLVGVAFPIYNGVTKHVRKKACETQQTIIYGATLAYLENGNNGKRHTFASVARAFGMTNPPENRNGVQIGPFTADQWPQEFLAYFEDNKAPLCPFDETKSTYTITFYAQEFDIPRFDIDCTADHSTLKKAETQNP